MILEFAKLEMWHALQVHSWEEDKNTKIFPESYHKFHLEIQILIRPGEGGSRKQNQ